MAAEEQLAEQLVHQSSRLRMDIRYPVKLQPMILDPIRHTPLPGPHLAGWVQRTPEALMVKFFDTAAGLDAKALVADDLLDVSVRPDGVLLIDGPEPPATVRFSDLRARGVVP